MQLSTLDQMNQGWNSEAAYTVSQINQYVARRLEMDATLQCVCVRGEISNYTRQYTSGHLYFTLKDEASNLRCVMFRSYTSSLDFEPENGMKVLVYGAIRSYAKEGYVQIVAQAIRQDGAGSLAQAFERLRKKLEAEGLFDPSKKKRLPPLPRRIGVITSPTGAAVQDIIRITGQRYPLCELIVYPALVQGAGAAESLIRGVQFFNAVSLVDVIILGRGGGSAEDLWVFNDENLARTVAASRLPIISAVGHESDVTICDFVADLRAPTPSGAAEAAVPNQADIRALLEQKAMRLQRAAENKMRYWRATVDKFKTSPLGKPPLAIIDDRRFHLCLREEKLQKCMDSYLEHTRMQACRAEELLNGLLDKQRQNKQNALAVCAGRLEAMSPLAVLARGYAVPTDANGKSVKDVTKLKKGDSLFVRFANGEAQTTVEKIQPQEKKALQKSKRKEGKVV